MLDSIILDKWQYKLASPPDAPSSKDQIPDVVLNADWQDTKDFPTTIYNELAQTEGAGVKGWMKGMGEWKIQWASECNWAFKTIFNSPQLTGNDNVELLFDGLDTFCEVRLNGKTILSNENQHHVSRVPVTALLTSNGGDNTLELLFESTALRGKKEESENGGPRVLWNGDSSRLYVRTAQYHYGWDWGPIVLDMGPYRPIHLIHYTTRLSKVDALPVYPKTSSSLFPINLPITFETTESASELVATVTLKSSSDKKVIKSAQVSLVKGKGKIEWILKEGDVDLWWPVRMGDQKQYLITVELFDANGGALDSVSKKIGFRKARILQDPLIDQEGTSFTFEINNKKVFIGGSNWIPADNLLTTISDERYRNWLELITTGNQNMVRVWAGGIYEPDVFYDICDELGILVWQDFMFGCGAYPAYDKFVASVKKEAEAVVERLKHHPALVLFAGNNEDYQVAESANLELDYSDETSDFRKTNFPARFIYERTLPEVVNRLSDIFYHRGSPYGGKDSTDQTVGDIHQWNVWHGTQQPWTNWDKLSGRFVSEFGMEAFPNIRTVDYWLDENKSERFPQSMYNVQHNKADGFERRLELYLVENYKRAVDMESYVYYTQVMQAETLASAYRLWRREFRGEGKEYNSGALVWQINDCWPVTSWAICDYFLRPKPAWFSIKRELAPYTVGVARKDVKVQDEGSIAFFTETQEISMWGTNSTYEPKKCSFELKSFAVDGTLLHEETTQVILGPNSSTEFGQKVVPGQISRRNLATRFETVIIAVRLLEADGTVIARYSDWPMPYKTIIFPEDYKPLKIKVDTDGQGLTLETSAPIKSLVLDVEGKEVAWGDQAIDICPGDKIHVSAKGLDGRKVLARYLGDNVGF